MFVFPLSVLALRVWALAPDSESIASHELFNQLPQLNMVKFHNKSLKIAIYRYGYKYIDVARDGNSSRERETETETDIL